MLTSLPLLCAVPAWVWPIASWRSRWAAHPSRSTPPPSHTPPLLRAAHRWVRVVQAWATKVPDDPTRKQGRVQLPRAGGLHWPRGCWARRRGRPGPILYICWAEGDVGDGLTDGVIVTRRLRSRETQISQVDRRGGGSAQQPERGGILLPVRAPGANKQNEGGTSVCRRAAARRWVVCWLADNKCGWDRGC